MLKLLLRLIRTRLIRAPGIGLKMPVIGLLLTRLRLRLQMTLPTRPIEDRKNERNKILL